MSALKIRPWTDESLVITTSGGGQNASKTKFHKFHDGVAACGTTPKQGEPTEWDVEKARVWRDPCKHCFADEIERGEIDP